MGLNLPSATAPLTLSVALSAGGDRLLSTTTTTAPVSLGNEEDVVGNGATGGVCLRALRHLWPTTKDDDTHVHRGGAQH